MDMAFANEILLSFLMPCISSWKEAATTDNNTTHPEPREGQFLVQTLVSKIVFFSSRFFICNRNYWRIQCSMT
jgi:hypothetical protein